MDERPPPPEVIEGLTTTSDKIRALADAGYSRSEIAKALDISYQHARNVLVARTSQPLRRPSAEKLLEAGFRQIDHWEPDGDGIQLQGTAPTKPAVYAFAVAGNVVYVGKASRSLRQRMGQYAKPGPTQSTNQRIHPLIRAELDAGNAVEVLAVNPGETLWRDLPVDLVAGLEAGLVRHYRPLWNQQGAKA